MSKEYDDTNRGALFKNDTEGKSENFPPYGGSINVDGADYWLSAWVKDGKNGKFFSLSVKPKEGRSQGGANQARGGNPDDDIPFSPIRGLA